MRMWHDRQLLSSGFNISSSNSGFDNDEAADCKYETKENPIFNRRKCEVVMSFIKQETRNIVLKIILFLH